MYIYTMCVYLWPRYTHLIHGLYRFFKGCIYVPEDYVYIRMYALTIGVPGKNKPLM